MSETLKIDLLIKFIFFELITAVLIAFGEISMPVPLDNFSSLSKDSNIHPEPVPISKILILLFLKKFTVL